MQTFTLDTHKDPLALLAEWITHAKNVQQALDEKTLQTAADFAVAISEKNHHPKYIHNGIRMAEHLLELHCDTETLAAALLYPTITADPNILEKTENFFSPVVEKMIRGAWLIQSIENKRLGSEAEQQKQLDPLRKMLLAMVDDVRTVLIKLAEQLTLLETARDEIETERKKIAERVRQIYAPLANRLGVGQLKWQLEDWAFRYLEPEAYSAISKSLNMRRKDREQFIHDMILELKNLVEKTHIKHNEVTGRAKHIYSIYKKLERKKIDFAEIYDASALRVIVPTVADCYAVLGIVHATWNHVPQEFDDYIAQPKPNGYQSIHTAVTTPQGRNVEIQIRTKAMHEHAEMGVAAHWAYKEGAKTNVQEKAQWLRQVMDWQEETGAVNHAAISDAHQMVYVFTPQGEIVDLPLGATPLDFAYHIHTNLGHSCRGAKVNGHLVSLTEPLKTGDQIHIQTIKNGEPSRDWLNAEKKYVTTHRARQKILAWFKKQEYTRNVALGSALWEKAIHHQNIPKEKMEVLLQHFHAEKPDDLFAMIGSGEINATSVLHVLEAEKNAPTAMFVPVAPTTNVRQFISHIRIADIDELVHVLAQCCKPIPGDDILGYISNGRGVVVHQKNCRNMQYLLEVKPERVLQIHWGRRMPQKFTVSLEVLVFPSHHPVSEITQFLTDQKIALLRLEVLPVKAGALHQTIQLSLQIQAADELHHTLQAFQKMAAVVSVRRV